MGNWVGEAFEKAIAGVAIATILLLILTLFIAPSRSTGLPGAYQMFLGAFIR